MAVRKAPWSFAFNHDALDSSQLRCMQLLTPDTTRRCESIVPLAMRPAPCVLAEGKPLSWTPDPDYFETADIVPQADENVGHSNASSTSCSDPESLEASNLCSSSEKRTSARAEFSNRYPL